MRGDALLLQNGCKCNKYTCNQLFFFRIQKEKELMIIREGKRRSNFSGGEIEKRSIESREGLLPEADEV